MIQKRILVAEDDPIARMVMLRTLTLLGYDSKGVTNGKEAVEELQSGAYDLVLMDCQMPDIDGLSATRRIRKLNLLSNSGKPMPVVAITSLATDNIEQKCLDAGMNHYLHKPVNPDHLAETIAKFLA